MNRWIRAIIALAVIWWPVREETGMWAAGLLTLIYAAGEFFAWQGTTLTEAVSPLLELQVEHLGLTLDAALKASKVDPADPEVREVKKRLDALRERAKGSKR